MHYIFAVTFGTLSSSWRCKQLCTEGIKMLISPHARTSYSDEPSNKRIMFQTKLQTKKYIYICIIYNRPNNRHKKNRYIIYFHLVELLQRASPGQLYSHQPLSAQVSWVAAPDSLQFSEPSKLKLKYRMQKFSDINITFLWISVDYNL